MGVHRTRGELNNEIKKDTHSKKTTALFGVKVPPLWAEHVWV